MADNIETLVQQVKIKQKQLNEWDELLGTAAAAVRVY